MKAVKAREQEEAAVRAKQARLEAEHGALELADYHDRARSAWLGSGGSAAEFSDATRPRCSSLPAGGVALNIPYVALGVPSKSKQRRM